MSAAAFFRLKKLTGPGIVKAAAMHNRRAIAAELGAAGHIDPSRCRLNIVMAGPDTPQGVTELAQSLMDAAGVGKLRRDAVRAVEAVFSLPATDGAGVDAAAYFTRCVEWASATFGPVLSADAHHDEAAPHVHVLCLPLVNGRMVGSDLMGGPSRLRTLQTDFHGKVAQAFGLKRGTARLAGRTREDVAAAVLAHLKAIGDFALKSAVWPVIRDAIDRDPLAFAQTLGFDVSSVSTAPKPGKTFTGIMTGRGKGAKTHAEQAHRDCALKRSMPIGFESLPGDYSGSSRELECLPEKTRTLACVGFTSPKGAA
ncbi:MAG: plasmid recombination protein [Leptothrix sp. (in: b-proteobacteria)]